VLELDAFILAAALLLLTPGPTNTLLAAGGALRGARRALPLITAELLGYAVAIVTLEVFVAPLVESLAWVRLALRIGCAVYLAYTAWLIWMAPMGEGEQAISWRRVFFATMSNPKALVFVFVILPPRSIGMAELVQPYGVILLALVALAGGAWVFLGAAIHAGARGRGGLTIRRTSSVVVGVFSALILASTLPSAASSAATIHAAATTEP
jgi:threonine/homoserine/homoserine lactone efflux protein